MEDTTALILVYSLITLLPIHVAMYMGLRRENKKRRHVLMAIWRFQNKTRKR